MIRLLAGDCRDVLAALPADGVQCVVTSPPYYALRSYLDASHPDKHREIGSEPTPDDYLATMVAVFREVRRVMRPDATCWVNMGDSFRDKQLLMMPARLALALQADGWWVRSDIIWHKPNPMPESVTDRPTSAHEHVFLLTKSARYYYDADAVREVSDASEASKARYAYGRYEGNGDAKRFERSGKPDYLTVDGNNYGQSGRNLRNVWTIATAPYGEAHFATFPPALAERCIKAGTSERGCCGQCGKPWVRVVERGAEATTRARIAVYYWPGVCVATVCATCVPSRDVRRKRQHHHRLARRLRPRCACGAVHRARPVRWRWHHAPRG